MTLNALEIIQPTLDKVKELLLPLDIVKWMKLALVVLIAGASGGGGQYFGNMGNMGDLGGLEEEISYEEMEAAVLDFLTEEILLAITIAVALLALLLIFWGYISSIFTFIFLESAITKEVMIIEGFKRNLGRGLSLFLFRAGITLAFLFLLASMITIPFLFLLGGDAGAIFSIPFFILSFLTFIPLILIFSVVSSMAVDFAAPIMSLQGDGIISGMRHSLGLFRKEILQFVVYYIMKMALGMAAGIISLVLLIPVMFIMGIGVAIFVVIGVLAGISLSWSPAIVVIIIIAAVTGVIFFVYLSALITLPIPVFFRYYSLMFLKEQDPRLDFEKGLH